MGHHYRRDITEAPAWCNKCNRETRHHVSDRRLAHCLQHEVQQYTKAQLKRLKEQEKKKQNPTLF